MSHSNISMKSRHAICTYFSRIAILGGRFHIQISLYMRQGVAMISQVNYWNSYVLLHDFHECHREIWLPGPAEEGLTEGLSAHPTVVQTHHLNLSCWDLWAEKRLRVTRSKMVSVTFGIWRELNQLQATKVGGLSAAKTFYSEVGTQQRPLEQ